ncbi:hypothetical protein [Paracoccus sp. SCSIO 75233]|uniref:hypothetical protein n=1 Tax=Paracoccus sp. SCSIO 75233 TaxID=3017782 RepID=UPI0022F04B87|nr:hypothetical protein [Paracoccus sp. SCSIO 75233]WBU53517.1 hypothetical protein PAF12_01360 [Paracoccus sp. SCSIO 75233]
MIPLIAGALSIILVAIAVTFLLSPLETLQFARYGELPDIAPNPDGDTTAEQGVDVFIVFVSGIGSISGEALLEAESRFLDRLAARLPNARIVRDVFPYAPSGRPLLTGQRFFSWFWRVVGKRRAAGGSMLAATLNIRNLYQVLVSADHRYGPLYSHSIAHIASDRLGAAGYPFGSGMPVILLGSSGGGQIAVGAVPYLREITRGPVSVLAFGGVMSADPGIADAEELISIYGDKDSVYRLGRFVFPGRWASSIGSSWNQAITGNRLREVSLPDIVHSGAGGYLDPSEWQHSMSRLDETVSEIANAVEEMLSSDKAAAHSQKEISS